MLKFLLLCLGTAVLMALSQRDNPVQQVHWGRTGHFMRRQTDIYMLIAILWLVCFSFLRTNYNDTTAYINAFRNAKSLSAGIASGIYVDWMENPFSALYRDLMRMVTKNYHVYFLLPALLHAIALVKLCKHYSVSPGMSLLLYFCLGAYSMMFLAAFKQSTAMAILLLALPYAQEKKYIRYALLVLLATLFHFYAIVYLIVPLLFGKPWGKTTWILVAGTLFTLATYDATLGAVMQNVEELGGDIAEEELFDGNSINVLRVAVHWVPGLLALVFRKHVNYQSTRMDNLFVNLSILCACVLTIGLAEGANLYGRMAGYFLVAICIALPYIIKKIFNQESAAFVSFLAVGMFLFYFYYEYGLSGNFGAEYRAISMWDFIVELLGLR